MIDAPGKHGQTSTGTVDLVWLGSTADVPTWALGDVACADALPAAVHALIKERLSTTGAQAWLFWDSALGAPDPNVVNELLTLPGQVWHAGLKLGTHGLPGIIDFITPTWMLNRDPDENTLATSWRLSLRACLIPIEVLRQMGNIRPEFKTLDAVSLEFGHRLVVRGVITRHIGQLVSHTSSRAPLIPFEDELRFAYYSFGGFWSKWALGRAVLTRYVSVAKALTSSREVFKASVPPRPSPFKHPVKGPTDVDFEARVSVLIPTLSRQKYLRTLLDQLRHQTVRPFEIIVVDQTPAEHRDPDLGSDFADLPLKILHLDRPGQCSSRNAGLKETSGDYVLFIDDDDEISSDLIEAHLRSLKSFSADVSCGVAEENGAGPLPEQFTYTRVSDVFPTNNSLVRIGALQKSGLFDLAFERGQRADHDLGMRLYLSGMLMVLNHEIAVFHHRAPAGGLRTHQARTITYASSRQKLNLRHLPSVTELYLALRYFTPRQLRELLWLRTFGTFSVRGHKGKRLLKIFAGVACLPDTVRRIRKEHLNAHAMCREFPRISSLMD